MAGTVTSLVIDLHCHVLHGIDDGPRTIADSLTLVRAAESAGIRTIVATPHVSPRYPNSADSIARALDAAKAEIRAEGIAVGLEAGAEIAMTTASELSPGELLKLRLGVGPWLLIECPFTSLATGFDTMLMRLQSEGHRIVLAHPERSPLFHQDPQMLAAIVRAGALASITAGSLVGRFGGRVRRFALQLAREDLIHNVASDAHDHRGRPPSIANELQLSSLDPLAEWLASEVPAAILAGDEIPPRPAVAGASRGIAVWRRKWRRRER
jgi:protein-tyrosine phosphatase